MKALRGSKRVVIHNGTVQALDIALLGHSRWVFV